jgi:uncharacterized protein (DUF2237 family)
MIVEELAARRYQELWAAIKPGDQWIKVQERWAHIDDVTFLSA